MDALAVAALVLAAGLWAGWTRSGERGRTAVCGRNLAVLGQAMDAYANDYGEALPPAVTEAPRATWDMLLRPYLRPDLVKPDSAYAVRQLKSETRPRFRCPSDSILRENARSYAFSSHDMKPENWPPGPDSRTGVGLRWNKNTKAALLDDEVAEETSSGAGRLALMKRGAIPAPSDTLLLTEAVDPANMLEKAAGATIDGNKAQLPADWNRGKFHSGRINYLMVDGRVERLSPSQTHNGGSDAGIWTIYDAD